MIDFKLKVLTPAGEKPLAEIREGDELYSATGTGITTNIVKKKYEGRSSIFARVSCNGNSISCVPEQYLAKKSAGRSKMNYTKVSQIGPGALVYRSEEGLTSPVEVTAIEVSTGDETSVIGLKFEKYPFNYIVDGFVVGSE